MAVDFAAMNIIVNAVTPGPTATESFYRSKSEAHIEGLKKAFPLGPLS